MDVQNPLNTSLDKLWLWIDSERDANSWEQAERIGRILKSKNREVMMLIKKELSWKRE